MLGMPAVGGMELVCDCRAGGTGVLGGGVHSSKNGRSSGCIMIMFGRMLALSDAAAAAAEEARPPKQSKNE